MAHANRSASFERLFGSASTVFYTAQVGSFFELCYISPNAWKVLGVRPESCVAPAAFWRDRVHADDIDHVLFVLAGLSGTGFVSHEFRFIDDQRKLRWLSNEVVCEEGGASGYLAGCLRDISLDKKAALELTHCLEAQRAQEYFYRSILDSVPQRLFWKDRNSVFRGCNLSGARALKLSCAAEIVGKTDYDFYANSEEAQYLRVKDEQVMNGGGPPIMPKCLPASSIAGWM